MTHPHKALLVVTFNRPEFLEQVIAALSIQKPKILRFSVDGPRNENAVDEHMVARTINIIKRIDWTSDLKIHKNKENLGLRRAIPKAVNWVLEEHDEIIVLEDDVIPGPDFYRFMCEGLEKFDKDQRIGVISGYNAVPSHILAIEQRVRITQFPKSYAWATWKRAWKVYSDELENVKNLKHLRNVIPPEVGSFGALAWRREFLNTKFEYIDSWFYRFVWSLWNAGLRVLSPNVNLVTYIGQKKGTNVKTKQRWNEIPVAFYDFKFMIKTAKFDRNADVWESKHIYRDNFKDFMKLYLVTAVLYLQKK